MHTYPGHSHFSIAISVVIAISIHVIMLAGLYALLNQPEPPVERTVQSIILSPSIAQHTEQNEAPTASTQNDRDLISTISDSEFTSPAPIKKVAEPVQENTTQPQTRSQQNSQTPARQQRTSKAPSVSVPTRAPQQRNTPNQQQLRSLFQQTATDQTAPIEQISTKSVAELSDYEKALLTQLSQESLYDEFHPVMLYNTKTQVDYILSLRLFKNGAIRSATLVKSSGIAEIDQLAIQSAYQASPFPAPPAKDSAIEYRYQIPIIYDRLNLINSGKGKQ